MHLAKAVRTVLVLLPGLISAACTTTAAPPDAASSPRRPVAEKAGEVDDGGAESRVSKAADTAPARQEVLPDEQGDFTVGNPGTLIEVASEVRRIEAAHPTTKMIVIGGDGEVARLVVQGVTGVEATKLAQLIGGRAEAAPPALEPVLVPELLQTTTSSLSLRSGPSTDDELVRPLPKGTVLVGFRGEIRGERSAEDGKRGRWTYVVPSEGQEGWSSSRFLRPLGRCAPTVESVLSDLPADRRDLLRPDLVIAHLVTYADERAHPGFLVVARDMTKRETHLGLYRATLACKLSKISTHLVMGITDEVLVTKTWAEGSTTLLVSWHERVPIAAESATNWTAFTPRFEGPAWNKRLFTGSWIPPVRRDTVRIVEPDELTRDTFGSICVDYLSEGLRDHYGPRQCFEFSTVHGFVEII